MKRTKILRRKTPLSSKPKENTIAPYYGAKRGWKIGHRPKKVRRPTRTSLKHKADALWSKLILSKGACEVCGRKALLNAHHIVGRRNLTLRYDPRNGCALCSGCHRLYKESAHEDPLWFIAWMMQNRPSDYNYLWEQKEKLTTYIDYSAIISGLEKLLKTC